LIQPDYKGGGITNLMASLVLALGGGDTGYAPVTGLDLERVRQARAVLLLVVDGLGYRYLQSSGSMLAACCQGPITSVCPSTTASAIPTFLTGRPPHQHGFTGWFTYFSELGAVLSVLPFNVRLGHSPVQALTPADLCGAAPVFDSLAVPGQLVMPDWIAGSVFNRSFSGRARVRPYRNLKGMERQITEAVKTGGYVYAYWPEFDALAHEFGVASPQVEAHFRQLDRLFESLIGRLAGSGTLLIVTADHGFIDTTDASRLRLKDHPGLAQTLMAPLCGEPRMAFCYVHPGRAGQFEEYVRDVLDREAQLLSSAEMVEAEWFGLGEPHPRLGDRVGHYALAMKENYIISGELPGERALNHIGVHGGLSGEEMLVPLIVAEC
jgi:hypothetical protein